MIKSAASAASPERVFRAVIKSAASAASPRTKNPRKNRETNAEKNHVWAFYIGIPIGQLQALPVSIGKLSGLLTLQLHGANLSFLPQSVGRLVDVPLLFQGLTVDVYCLQSQNGEPKLFLQ